MADIKAGQRVRLWDGTSEFGFLVTAPLFTSISDGTNAASVSAAGNVGVVELNSAAILADTAAIDSNMAIVAGAVVAGQMQVDIVAPLPAGTNNIGDVDVLSVIPGVAATNLGKARDSVAGATDTGVSVLGIRDDALTTLTEADGDYTNFRFTSTGALWVATTAAGNTNIIQDDSAFTPGTSYVGATGYMADEATPDSVDEGDVGIPRMTLTRIALGVIADATTNSQRLAVSAAGAASTNITQVLGATHSESNPLFVQIVSGVVSGNEVISTLTSVALAKDASVNLDYTVTGSTTAKVLFIRVHASGAFKAIVSTGPVAGLIVRETAFASAVTLKVDLAYQGLLEVPSASTGTIRITVRNDDNAAMDVFATIVMTEVA